jgi:ABC-type Mn2+/Zn2+ transport system ATPase subunit
MNNINCISNVKIKGLWNKFDLDWTLNPDVNILSGINGSGKSTVLGCMVELLQTGELQKLLQGLMKEVNITFDNHKSFSCKLFTISNLETQANTNHRFKKLIEELKEEHGDKYQKLIQLKLVLLSMMQN